MYIYIFTSHTHIYICVCVCELEIVMIHPGPFDNVAQQDVIVINITCQVMARRVNTFWDAISTSTSELLLFSCWLVLLARSDRGIVYNGKDMRRWCRERERIGSLHTSEYLMYLQSPTNWLHPEFCWGPEVYAHELLFNLQGDRLRSRVLQEGPWRGSL